MTHEKKKWVTPACDYGLLKKFAYICVVNSVVVCLLYVLLFYEDYSSSLQVYDFKISNSDIPYVTRFSNMTIPKQKEKTIAVWTSFFKSMSWLSSINSALFTCPFKCQAVGGNGVFHSDAVLFHYQRYDLQIANLPKKRNPDQIWVIYILEPTVYIERNTAELNGIFNWTMSYRRDSTVFAPYGSFIERQVMNDIRPFSKRKKFAYAVFSRCNDIGKRYRVIKELQKYIDIDIYGSCGSFKCDTKSQGCLSTNHAQDYLFRFSFENSHCQDYVTEKLWFPLQQGVIPVVNWVRGQEETRVNTSHMINLYDFRTIKDLADYLKSVAANETLYNSYLTWRKTLDVVTSHFHSFCGLCRKLHQPVLQRQVYSDLNGWISNDICPKYKVRCLAMVSEVISV